MSTGGQRHTGLRCFECSEPGIERIQYRCNACDGPLIAALGAPTAPLLGTGTGYGVWRRGHMLPETRSAVSLGEGDTPLLPFNREASSPLWLKLESLNPTLSFKDRAMALGASIATDEELPGLALASTGNAAVSAAAYAAAAGLPCRIVCGTQSGASSKLRAAASYGAEVETLEGDYSHAYARITQLERDGWFNVSTTYRNPYLLEAYRPIAAELLSQLGSVPNAIVVPVGAGPLLRGLYHGFQDLVASGAVPEVPRLVGVQAAACSPLADAWGNDRENWLSVLQETRSPGSTLAGAIADPLRGYEREGLLTLDAVDATGGWIVAVDEIEMRTAGRELASRGVLVEPASAAALAAAKDPRIRSSDGATVLMLTGHGAKDPESMPIQAELRDKETAE